MGEVILADIKILVACHKPSELPQNDLFLPIQVGAAQATKRLPIAQDNDGENISDKNAQYCELTAQYWAWKNLKADYYGLCHYRRFLCFRNVPDAKRNYRGQIEGGALNQFSISRFGLDDAEEMRKVIEANDVVIGEEQNVRQLYTPRGNKKTAYEHWVAHNRVLIMQHDLDTMLDILEEVDPAVGQATREYLNGPEFLGFNCFIMKRELFDRMCEIEFKVLDKLEQQVDLSRYHQQLSRIYGFMGEIITSGFFYYLSKNQQYKIKHVPLIYFDYTDALGQISPLHPDDDHSIPIIFDFADSYPLRFGTTWRTLLDHLESDYQYDVLLVADLEADEQKALTDMAADYDNVSLRFMAAEPVRRYITDKYGIQDVFIQKLKHGKINPKDDDLHTPILPILPFLLVNYQRALVFDKNILFGDSIVPLWQEHAHTAKLVAAPPNVYVRAKVNDLYFETAERTLSYYLKDPHNYFSINAFVWNFQKFREQFSEAEVLRQYNLPGESKRVQAKEEILNILCEGDVDFTEVRWNTWFDSNAGLKNQLSYAPLSLYQELLKARKNPGVITFMADDPWEVTFTQFTPIYWAAARRTPFYESYLRHDIDLTLYNKQHHVHDRLNQVFPVGGRMRNVLAKALPYGSQRYQAAKKLLELMRLR